MDCTIYRAAGKEYTYLYLRADLSFDDLPAALVPVVTPADVVMKVVLTPERPLANADVSRVIEALTSAGYYVQLPPSEDPTGWLEIASARR